jgi:hypothetical protein
MYSTQHNVIKFVINLQQVVDILRGLRFPPPIKTDRHDIAEILLKVALNTITLTLNITIFVPCCKACLYMGVGICFCKSRPNLFPT